MSTKYILFIRRLALANEAFDYDYTDTPYGTRMEKVEVLCNVHGPFSKSVQQLERGKGCTECLKALQRSAAQGFFVAKAKRLHGGKYTYEKVEYVTNKQHVTITCLSHGDFIQSPDNHLAGHGCKECQYLAVTKKNRKSRETFIAQAVAVHGDVYDYSLVVYINSSSKVKIVLPSGEVVEQLPGHHLAGCRPSAEPRGLDYQRPGMMYYLRVTVKNQVLYKIGITTRDIEARFPAADLNKLEVLTTKNFKTVREAYDTEQTLLKQYKNYQYIGPNVLRGGGNTELFTEDVLGLDEENKHAPDPMGQQQTRCNVDV